MLKLVRPDRSGLLHSVKLCYRHSGDEDTHSKQPKGKTWVTAAALFYCISQ